jgi:hypothetical protein
VGLTDAQHPAGWTNAEAMTPIALAFFSHLLVRQRLKWIFYRLVHGL